MQAKAKAYMIMINSRQTDLVLLSVYTLTKDILLFKLETIESTIIIMESPALIDLATLAIEIVSELMSNAIPSS